MAKPKKFPAKVQTTMRPDRDVEVDEVEYDVLARRGYLKTDATTVAPDTEKQKAG